MAFFSDAACTTAAPALTIASGGATAQLYVKATVAGALAVRAAPDALPSVQTSVSVQPLAPTAISFAVAPAMVSVDTCSTVFEVRSQDALGNQSAPSGPTMLVISAMPAAGVAFFEDDTCTTPVNAPQLDVSVAQVRFFLKSSIAAMVRLDASGAALSSATADVEVVP